MVNKLRKAFLATLLSSCCWLLPLNVPTVHAQAVNVTPSAINLSCIPLRTSGVAPLVVMFDCTGTTASTVSQPFIDLLYTWDFGDAVATPVAGACGTPIEAGEGFWRCGSGRGSASKNVAYGPVASHVFETAGDRTVTVAITDGTNSVTWSTVISVSSPSTAYAASDHVCLATVDPVPGTDGCPAGASHFAITDWCAAVNSYLATGKRLMVRRGESFTCNATAWLTAPGPWTIEAYGSGAKPAVTVPSTVPFAMGMGRGSLGLQSGTDGRVIDTSFTGPNLQGTNLMDGKGNFSNLLYLRVDGADFNAGWGMDALNNNGQTRPWSGFSVVESSLTNMAAGGGNGMFIGSFYPTILGNYIDNNFGGEHNFRSMWWKWAVVGHNTMRNPHASKSQITMRAPRWGATTSQGYAAIGMTAQMVSKFGVISDNELTGGTGGALTLYVDAYPLAGMHSHVLVERNWIHSPDALPAGSAPLELMSRYSAVRNNIIDTGTNTDISMACISLAFQGGTNLPEPSYNWIDNNTCHTTSAYTTTKVAKAVSISNTSHFATVRNNLIYAPNATQVTTNVVTILNSNGTTVGASGTHGNNSNADAKVSPMFTTTPPTLPAHYKPTCTGSTYPCQRGISLGNNRRDFFHAVPAATPDIGAVQH